MKQINFEHGSITKNILSTSFPLLIAQIVNLLYNIVDRIYIARIPHIGTTALSAVGMSFPIFVILSAFANLFGSGGAPLFSIHRGAGEEKTARDILQTSFSLLLFCSLFLTIIGLLFAMPILRAFNAPKETLTYALPYLMICMIGSIPSMLSIGLNPFINAQGYPLIGMVSVSLGALSNIVLDPIFIFVCKGGIIGAALATVISQYLCALFICYILARKMPFRIRLLSPFDLFRRRRVIFHITTLGTAGFIMQLTNSLVSIVCNRVLASLGGTVYISVMTVLMSIRQVIETPIHAIAEGSSPLISFHYGAGRMSLVKKAVKTMAALMFLYTAVSWGIILFSPRILISLFTEEASVRSLSVHALTLYFSAFIFMDLQYIGQTTFKSLNRKKPAIFFSLLRKVVIVVPLTYLLPHICSPASDGVFLAEPVSNVIGGSLCFAFMLFLVSPLLASTGNKND